MSILISLPDTPEMRDFLRTMAIHAVEDNPAGPEDTEKWRRMEAACTEFAEAVTKALWVGELLDGMTP